MKYICNKSSNQEMFAISLSSYSRYNANFKLDQSVLAIHDSPLYYEISEDDHQRTVTHARDHSWTLDFANAFVSPDVNSRAELVPSHGASRCWLGEYIVELILYYLFLYTNLNEKFQYEELHLHPMMQPVSSGCLKRQSNFSVPLCVNSRAVWT
jgi:hypothetical protein